MIPQIRPMALAEIRDTPIQKLISKRINEHTIVLFPTDEKSLFDKGSGSGTLCVYKGLKGILTAAHVAMYFQSLAFIVVPYALRSGTKDIWDLKKISFFEILYPSTHENPVV